MLSKKQVWFYKEHSDKIVYIVDRVNFNNTLNIIASYIKSIHDIHVRICIRISSHT